MPDLRVHRSGHGSHRGDASDRARRCDARVRAAPAGSSGLSQRVWHRRVWRPRRRPACSSPARNRRSPRAVPGPAPSAAAHGASIDALRSPAWTAADLTGSVPLTDGRRLWLYGDTITSGLGPTGGAVSRSFTARNSAIVQERGCLTPLLQGSGPTAGSWIPQLGAEWSWPGDGYARDGTVWVYATRLGEIGPGVFGFEARAVDLVEVDQATLTIRRVHRNRYAAAPVLLGSSVTTDGTWTYVYGRDERGSKRNTYVARVPAANPLATTTYWTGAAVVDRPRPGPAHLHDRRGRRTGLRRSRSGLRGQAVRGGREGRRVPHELGRAVHRAGTGRTLGQGHDRPGRRARRPTRGRGPTWRRSTASTPPRAACT